MSKRARSPQPADDNHPTPWLNGMPHELWTYIFSFFSFRMLKRCRLLCRQWWLQHTATNFKQRASICRSGTPDHRFTPTARNTMRELFYKVGDCKIVEPQVLKWMIDCAAADPSRFSITSVSLGTHWNAAPGPEAFLGIWQLPTSIRHLELATSRSTFQDVEFPQELRYLSLPLDAPLPKQFPPKLETLKWRCVPNISYAMMRLFLFEAGALPPTLQVLDFGCIRWEWNKYVESQEAFIDRAQDEWLQLMKPTRIIEGD